MAPQENPRGVDLAEHVRIEVAAGKDAEVAAQQYKENPVWYRWRNCQTLARWTPDGILASKEHDCVMDNSNPGEAYNVAIGGPTLARNSSVGDYPQHFDDGVRVLDKLFVGLIATENRITEADGSLGSNRYFSYKYKLFTSRQLAWAPLSPNVVELKDMAANAPGGDNKLQPTADEFARMVQVWRVGSVLDSKAGMMPYKCATVNVVVEEWSLEMIQLEYNEYFGESLALAVLDGPMAGIGALDLLAMGAALVDAALIRLLKGRPDARPDPVPPLIGAVLSNYTPGLVGELQAWTDVDRAHAEDEQLRRLRNAANRTNVPAPGAPRETRPGGGDFVGQHGHTLGVGKQKFYNSASPETKRLYAAYNNLAQADRDAFNPAGIAALAPLGRAAALNGNTKFVQKLTDDQKRLLKTVVEYHARVVAATQAMRAGEKIRAALAAGKLWPIL